MSPLFRRRGLAVADAETPPEAPASADPPAPAAAAGIAPRRPHAGLLRRERRALLKARATRVTDLGGLLLEMYRHGAFRDDLLAEHCADVVGIDARLAEIDALLNTRAAAPRCTCGAPILLGSHFCPNCGRSLVPTANGDGQSTMIEPGPNGTA